jgi:tripartite-type tricarboxylate transporter receptor subunit TctC
MRRITVTGTLGRAVMLGLLSGLAVCCGQNAARAAYPDHVITAVVPFDVGGASDILARIVATRLGPVLGENVVILNKAGAAGNVGMSFVAHAKPDGYTLLFTAPASTQNPAMYRHMPYDPRKDLVAVAEDGEAYDIVAVSVKNVPSTNLVDFVKLVRDHPGKFNAAAGGLSTRLSAEFFRIKNGLKIEILPYSSAGDAATALMTGEADFMVVDAAALNAGVSAGKTRMLAVTGDARLPAYPDVPTTTEAGLPQYKDFEYHGLYAPGGTPPAILEKLNAAVNQVTQQPDVIAQFRKLGWVAVHKSQKDFEAFYLSELAKWKSVVKDAHIPPVD